ncbi:MAG TPA: carbohydrate kinase [Holophaga sp.]|nr:carbohydrate kinase [Holophaga sp.]
MPRKERILALIRENPFIAQQELAGRLGITRSAVASHIAQLTREGRLLGRAYVLPGEEPILVAGGANLDRIATGAGPVRPGTSNPVTTRETFGGVARNVAENLAHLGLPVRLMTVLGEDAAGEALARQAQACGIDTGASRSVPGGRTGTYTALLQPDGELVLGMADMGILDAFTPAFMQERRPRWAMTRMRVVDCNLPAEALSGFIEDSRRSDAQLVVVAVSEPKMARLPASLAGVLVLLLNRGELAVRVGRDLSDRAGLVAACREVQAQGARSVVVTLGPEGTLGCWDAEQPFFLPAPAVQVVDVTGAGDAFSSGVVASLARHPGDLSRACRLGQRLAALTLASPASVAPGLSPALLDDPSER